jgi:Mg-chelatase subunit ChlD
MGVVPERGGGDLSPTTADASNTKLFSSGRRKRSDRYYTTKKKKRKKSSSSSNNQPQKRGKAIRRQQQANSILFDGRPRTTRKQTAANGFIRIVSSTETSCLFGLTVNTW